MAHAESKTRDQLRILSCLRNGMVRLDGGGSVLVVRNIAVYDLHHIPATLLHGLCILQYPCASLAAVNPNIDICTGYNMHHL